MGWMKQESLLRALHFAVDGRETKLEVGAEGDSGAGGVLRVNERSLLGRMREWLVEVLKEDD